MAKVFLVRHGEAAAGFDGHLDPGLSALGIAQAEAAAEALDKMARIPLGTSPLARARETAHPLERRWSQTARVIPAIGEIPSTSEDLDQRTQWLRSVMTLDWGALDAERQAWRSAVLRELLALPSDMVLFSHFVAINVAVGSALGDDRVTCFSPDNASITILETDGARLRLIEKGRERATVVR